jgi:hypothetical protein
MVWIWEHNKRTDDNKIILNCVKKLMKNKFKNEKKAGKDPNFFKINFSLLLFKKCVVLLILFVILFFLLHSNATYKREVLRIHVLAAPRHSA